MFRRFLAESLTQRPQNNDDPNEPCCLIRWTDSKKFVIVSQRKIRAPSKTIILYETYTINDDGGGEERTGRIIFKGTRKECETLHYNVDTTPTKSKPVTNSEKTKKSNDQQVNTASSSASDILSDVKDDSDDDKNASEREAIGNAVLMRMLQLVLQGSADGEENEPKHKVPCSACDTNPISSDRYKCLNCKDLNLCGSCFERRIESKEHKSGHAFAHFKSPGELFGEKVSDEDVTFNKLKKMHAGEVHESITCDGCKAESIKGLRFKCDTCPNYDLCPQCVENHVITKTHKSSHPLILIPRRAIQQIPAEDIQLGDELGSGAFGSVFKAKWISKNRPVACKVITVPRASGAEVLEKSFLKELAAYAELSGAYILKTYGFAAYKQGQNKQYILVMEYMAQGSLSNVIKEKGKKISLRRKLDMARNIASGMRKIHEHSMIHRDIRPDNILVNENYTAKIGDMGIARVVDPLNQHTQIGCGSYMPPEFYEGSYDQKLDIFTFGLTLNELFTSTRHTFQQCRSDKIIFQEKSPIFDDLIARCTAYNPKRRPAAIEIEKTLDIYSAGFNEIVMKKHPGYMKLSTEDKDKIFVAFYEKFHDPATEFIHKQFPPEFLDGPNNLTCVKVDKNASNEIRIQCPMQ
ncbi:unnamed protein product [Rotaria socialis]|uniref:Uncharacterized protein n=1 Tax=Rotaria socialis TaxID=392032 RepID=A0A820UZ93_9BILA|nr:unnamed protein product [Rotaria socialis]CAF3371810.1 unnamed protein product [Rotaria socialis]CAF3415023.1 unnamed protein product [Rotaria socialis]CAF3428819.1 unnamed protein product [Rotaria socialis]CAF3597776.1 unnamed protein product [Rotaria socialis]